MTAGENFFRFFRALSLAIAAAAPLVAGLHPETGLYPFEKYGADQYGAAAQNWAIAQDGRGIMYFGNTDGVLEFDGSSWRVIRANGAIRSLAADAAGTIYVGGSGDFGYLHPDARGQQQFVSLKSKLPARDASFKDVWRVFVQPDGVYFSSYNWLARLGKSGYLKVWRPASTFGKAFAAAGGVYVRTPENGLTLIGGSGPAAVRGGDALAGKDLKLDPVGAVPLGGGALFATQEHLFTLDAAGVAPFDSAALPYLAKNTMYTMTRLAGGQIAVGTRRGGLVLMDDSGTLERVISEEDGLPDAYVTAIAADREGSVWLTLVNGNIARFNPGLSTYTRAQGLLGNVYCATRAFGKLYAGTTAGLFVLTPEAGAAPRFTRIPEIADTVFVLSNVGGELLAGTSKGVLAVNEDHAIPIPGVTGTVYDLNASLKQPGRVYAAGRDAVFMLHKDNDYWTAAGAVSEPGQEFRTIVEDADGRVWATTRTRIWRLDFTRQPVQAASFPGGGTNADSWQNAYRLRGHVVFGSEQGLMRFSENFQRLVPDSNLGSMFADGSRDVYSILEDPASNIWISGLNYHGLLRRNGSQTRWEAMPLLEAKIQGIFNLYADPDGTVWASGKDYKLFRWTPRLAGDANRDFHLVTRRIGVLDAAEPLFGGAGPNPAIALKYRDNALTFQFAAPFYQAASTVEYQYRLEGSDRGWSAWSHEAKAVFNHLPEGNYRFHVRARNPHGVATEEAVSDFRIAPPWYRTWWAYVLYSILAAFFVWAVVKMRVRQLQEDKRRLENTVAERTVEIRKQRDEIQVQERKSHSLLLNILPSQVADELKSTGAVQPVGFDDVTVCFTDFVGFTLSSEKMPPSHLVDALNEYFTAFDEIIARYSLEKLKTIGDSYMFVSGLPERRASHAVDAVLAAMEMVQVVKELARRPDTTGWNIRVGLHSGPVVAGVVGIRKFAFDIWGNTVNFAARMESSGVPGSVNMSERTCRLTRGLIECEGRGHVRIKEGRELPMFLAKGPADDFAARYAQEFGAQPLALPRLRLAAEEPAARGAVS